MNGPIGGSQQYFTRTAVTPAGTSNGSSTKLPCCSEPNSPVNTWFGSIAAPPQEVGPSMAAGGCIAIACAPAVEAKTRHAKTAASGADKRNNPCLEQNIPGSGH